MYVVWKGMPDVRSKAWQLLVWSWRLGYMMLFVLILWNEDRYYHGIESNLESWILRSCMVIKIWLVILIIFYDPGKVLESHHASATIDWNWCERCHFAVPPNAIHCKMCD